MKDALISRARDMQSQLSARYQVLSGREQILVTFMGAVVSGAFFLMAIWQPLENYLANAKASYIQALDMQSRLDRIAQAPRLPQTSILSAGTGAPLPILLTDTSRNNGIVIKRLEMDKQNRANLILESVNFNQLLTWLYEIAKANHVLLESATITKTTAPGIVDATVILSQ